MRNFKKKNQLINIIVLIVLLLLTVYLINKYFIQSNFGTTKPPVLDSTTCQKICDWVGPGKKNDYIDVSVQPGWYPYSPFIGAASQGGTYPSTSTSSIVAIYRDGTTGTPVDVWEGHPGTVVAQVGGYVVIRVSGIKSACKNKSWAWKVPVNLDLLNCKSTDGKIKLAYRGFAGDCVGNGKIRLEMLDGGGLWGSSGGVDQPREGMCFNNGPWIGTTDTKQGIDSCRLAGNRDNTAQGEGGKKGWYEATGHAGTAATKNMEQGALAYTNKGDHAWNGTLPPACCSTRWHMPGADVDMAKATALVGTTPNVAPYSDCCSAGNCPGQLCGGFGVDPRDPNPVTAWKSYPGNCAGFDTYRRNEENVWFGAPKAPECYRYEPDGCLPSGPQQYFGGPLVPFGSGEAQWGTGEQPGWLPYPGWPACEGKKFNGYTLRNPDKTGSTDLIGCDAGYRAMSTSHDLYKPVI